MSNELKTWDDQSVVATSPIAAGMVIVPNATSSPDPCPNSSVVVSW